MYYVLKINMLLFLGPNNPFQGSQQNNTLSLHCNCKYD